MAFKLTKAEINNRTDRAEKARRALGTLNGAIDQYNEVVDGERDKIEEALTAYNAALVDLKTFTDEIGASRRSEFNEKTEKWQEGERGEEAGDWISAWEDIDIEDAEVELPEPLERVEDDVISDFEGLAETIE